MPRISEERAPAEPTSDRQKERQGRILRACARLAAEHGLERMQMQDVARDAGVAIATVYRYFPSKTELLVAVLQAQVDFLDRRLPPLDEEASRAEAVADVLIIAARELLARPRLATALLQAHNAELLRLGERSSEVTAVFQSVILTRLRVDEPAETDLRLVRLVEQAYYGVLVSALNGHITATQAEADIRLATRLLLGPTYEEGVEPAG